MSLTPADYGQLTAACASMERVVDEMDRAKTAFGMAKAVIEFSGDQRKAILAKAMLPFLSAGDAASTADARARATEEYGRQMARLKQDLANAESVVAQYFALKARWETARSKASAEKAMVTL